MIVAGLMSMMPVNSQAQTVTTRPTESAEYLQTDPSVKALQTKQTGAVRNRTNFNFNINGTMDKDLSLVDVIQTIGDSDKLFDLLIPGYKNLNNLDFDKYLQNDLHKLQSNLDNFMHGPEAAMVRNAEFSFNQLLSALESKDIEAARTAGQQLSQELRQFQDALKQSGIEDRFKDIFDIESETLGGIKKIPNIFNQFERYSTPTSRGMKFEREVTAEGKFSLYSVMEAPEFKFEQAKILRANGTGKGKADIGASWDLGKIVFDFENRTAEWTGHDIRAYAGYEYLLDYTLEDTDANQMTLKLKPNLYAGIGMNKTNLEVGHEDFQLGFNASLDGFHNINKGSDLEEISNSTLTHMFVDRKGKKAFYFVDLADVYTETKGTLEVENDGKITTTATDRTSRDMQLNLFAGKTFGKYTPFIGMKDSEGNLGVYFNSKLVTASVNSNNEQEIYLKLGKNDAAQFLEHVKELDRLRYSHFAGREHDLVEARHKLNEAMRGIMLKYASKLEGKEYSVVIGRGKVNVEAGQSVDELTKTDFIRLNIGGVRLFAEYGKQIHGNDRKSENYGITMPAGIGGLEVDLYKHEELGISQEDRPDMNVQLKKRFRF